jgi:hypothetical protein
VFFLRKCEKNSNTVLGNTARQLYSKSLSIHYSNLSFTFKLSSPLFSNKVSLEMVTKHNTTYSRNL